MQVRFGPENTYVDQLMVVSLLQVMEDRSIVKIGQIGHIFGFLVFGRIDLLEEIFLKITGLCFFGRKKNGILMLVELVDLRILIFCSSVTLNCAKLPPRLDMSNRTNLRHFRISVDSLVTILLCSKFVPFGGGAHMYKMKIYICNFRLFFIFLLPFFFCFN